MKPRILTAFLLCAAAATSLGACEGDHWGYYYGPPPVDCGQFSSCGSCTPVVGCGWCSFDGGGVCLSGPGLCGVSKFTWVWEPSECSGAPGQQDAGGTPAPSGDGGNRVPEAGPPVPADAAPDR